MNEAKFTDGEMIAVLGGPLDGGVQAVSVLFGSVPSYCFHIRVGKTIYRYKLDQSRRAWVFDRAEKVRIKQ